METLLKKLPNDVQGQSTSFLVNNEVIDVQHFLKIFEGRNTTIEEVATCLDDAMRNVLFTCFDDAEDPIKLRIYNTYNCLRMLRNAVLKCGGHVAVGHVDY